MILNLLQDEKVSFHYSFWIIKRVVYIVRMVGGGWEEREHTRTCAHTQIHTSISLGNDLAFPNLEGTAGEYCLSRGN